MRLFRSPTKDFCYEWITSHKSLSLRLPLVTCKGGIHISNSNIQILRVLMHTRFQPQIDSRPRDILPCFWTFTQSILTADTRRYTRTFCLADPGQIEDAFASRNVHAAEKNTEAWLPMPTPSRWDESPFGRGHDDQYPATVGRIFVCGSLRRSAVY